LALLEILLLRLLLWVGLPLLLLALTIGPRRISRAFERLWHSMAARRHDPAAIIADVVKRQQEQIETQRHAVLQAENALAEIARHIQTSETAMPALEQEARDAVARSDDLGARAALYKLQLERLAVQTFGRHRELQFARITEGRSRLYMMEMQLRQYEVGRSVLLSQLAQAKTVEQQYSIARKFDPFKAVANWADAEGLVSDKENRSRAVERVAIDLGEPQPGFGEADAVLLEAQLRELKSQQAIPRLSVREDSQGSAEAGHSDSDGLRPEEKRGNSS